MDISRLHRLIWFRRHLDRGRLRLAIEVLFWFVLGLGFEILGRRAPGDWVDLLAGVALVGLAAAAANPPLALALPRELARAVRRLGNRLESLFDAHYGADFHPTKPPHLKTLGRYRRTVAVLALVDLALVAIVLAFGSPLLATFRVSYLLYLALWAIASLGIAVTVTSLVLTVLQQLRRAPGRHTEPRQGGRRRGSALVALGILGTVILVLIDTRVGPAGWLGIMLLGLLALAPPRVGPPVEFRLNLRIQPRGGGPPRLESTTVEEMVRSFLGILILTSLGLSLIVQGHRLPFTPETPEMASRFFITHYVGRVVSWVLGAGCLTGTALYLGEFIFRRRRSDPAIPGPVATDREAVLRLVEKNLELARSGRRDRGDGFLFAPHWWPSDRMYRDSWHEEDLSEGSAGPDFHRHYGQPARRLLRRVLRALAIDLIFIEDGVPARSVPAALRVLFHHYDATGGEDGHDQIIEERHLNSPPGLHLVLQEIDLDRPARDLGGYKEPSYESLSRARVFLILRSRGGEDVPDEDPFAFTSEPGWVDRFLSRIPTAPVVTAG